MGLHVLDAEPDARGPHKLGDFRKRVAPRGFVIRAVIDQLMVAPRRPAYPQRVAGEAEIRQKLTRPGTLCRQPFAGANIDD